MIVFEQISFKAPIKTGDFIVDVFIRQEITTTNLFLVLKTYINNKMLVYHANTKKPFVVEVDSQFKKVIFVEDS